VLEKALDTAGIVRDGDVAVEKPLLANFTKIESRQDAI
jgi:hypothetical protein